MDKGKFKDNAFLRSALSIQGCIHSIPELLNWVGEQNKKVTVNVKETSFEALQSWKINSSKLSHESGNFFSIEGVRVHTNSGYVANWTQPIINQPEIGYLGFIVKEFSGVLYFLMQAKIEPGNVNNVQLSPTLQATKSNYTRIHKGKAPDYLEYFQTVSKENVLLDQLQSEQGGRFLKKRTRNIIINVDDDIVLKENFIWVTLGQIKQLMFYDNVVNMDSRTVISGIPYCTQTDTEISELMSLYNIKDSSIASDFLKSHVLEENGVNSFGDILSFITDLKCKLDLNVQTIPLSSVEDWSITDRTIQHNDQKYFSIIGAEIEISNREVTKWFQPLVKPSQDGICAFVCKKLNGVLHFIVQAKVECGNFDILELAPTVQCLTGNYNNEDSINMLPFLEYVLKAEPSRILFDTKQSEEGGRFYREQNRNLIILAGDEIEEELPSSYIWMTLKQLQTFIQFNNYINIQARSLMAAIPFNT